MSKGAGYDEIASRLANSASTGQVAPLVQSEMCSALTPCAAQVIDEHLGSGAQDGSAASRR
jgi:hypothetical protein